MKVSVIVPVYNQPVLVKRALDSVPFDENIEIVVVDDGSTDNTLDVLKSYGDRIKLISCEGNYGPNHARNVAIENSNGEYIIGLDDDDYFYTDEFRKAIRELDGTDFVFVDCKVNSGDVWELNEKSKYVLWAFWTKFVRREFIGDVRSPEIFNCDGDKTFFKQLFTKPHTEKYTHLVVYHYDHPRVGSLLWKKDHDS